MKRFVMVALVIGLLVGATDPKDNKKDVVKKETKKLEGTWTVVSQERGGSAVKKNSKGTFTFAKSKLIIKGDKEGHEKGGKFKVAPTKSPKEIDIVADTPDGEEKLKGIYQIKRDSLKICLDEGANDRRNSPPRLEPGKS
jgi:uncharacterized protein (TIGR03067 family)